MKFKMTIDERINQIYEIWHSIEVDTRSDLGRIWLDKEKIEYMEAEVEELEDKILQLLRIIKDLKHDRLELKKHMEHLLRLLHHVKPEREWQQDIKEELDEIAREVHKGEEKVREITKKWIEIRRKRTAIVQMAENSSRNHPRISPVVKVIALSINSKGAPLTAININRLNNGDSRIDPNVFEVYRIMPLSGNIIPNIDIDVAWLDPAHGVEATTRDEIEKVTYFSQKDDKISTRKLAKGIDFAAVVDPKLYADEIANAIIYGINQHERMCAVEYYRGRIFQSFQQTLLAHRINVAFRFGEIYVTQPNYEVPELGLRIGYRMEFSQGTNLKWIIETNMSGRVNKVIIKEGPDIIDPMVVNKDRIIDPRPLLKPAHKIPYPPGYSAYSKEHIDLVEEIKRVILESGKLLGHNYSSDNIESLTAPQPLNILEIGKTARHLNPVRWIYEMPRI